MISVFNLEEICLETPKRLKGQKEDSILIVTGTIDDPIYISTDNSNTNTPTNSSINGIAPPINGTNSPTCGPDLTNTPKHSTYSTIPTTNTPNHTPTNTPNHKPTNTPNKPNTVTPIRTQKLCRKLEYKHKFLLKLRKKQYDNNFDLGLYFLVRFGGPKSSMGASILMDDELLECSELSKFRNNRDLNEWFDFQYKSLYKGLRKRLDFSNLPLSQVNKRLSRELPRKRWFTREKLYNKTIEQENWNPFSIFGSLPYVSLNDVFNLESSKNYIIGSLKDFLINSITVDGSSVTVTGPTTNNTNGTTNITNTTTNTNTTNNKDTNKDTTGEDNTSTGTNTGVGGPDTVTEEEKLFNYLNEKWKNESKKVTNWNNDPLLTTEVLWYINATNKYLDKSQNVCILQKCFCVTPDPNIRFNWNDPRCSIWRNYDGPRPSMGEILTNSNYKNSLEKFNNIKNKIQKSNHISQDDHIKLQHYYNYFNLNHY